MTNLTQRARASLAVNTFRLAYRAAPREFALLIVFQLIAAAAAFVEVILLRHLVTHVAERGHPDVSTLQFPGIALLASLGLGSLAANLQRARSELFGELIGRYGQREVLHHAAEATPESFDDPTFLDRLQRAMTAGRSRPREVATSLVQLTSAAISVIALGAALIVTAAALAPVLIIASLPVVISARRSSLETYQYVRGVTEVERRRSAAAAALTSPDFARETSSYGAAPFFLKRFDHLSQERVAGLREVITRRTRRTILAESASFILFAMTFAVAVFLLARGTMTLGAVTAGLAVSFGVHARLVSLGGGAVRLDQALMNISDFYDFVGTEDHATKTDPAPSNATTDPPKIQLADVSFTYPGRRHPALDAVSITFTPGSLIAIVGENGAGKSTLVKILSGLYQPTHGQIFWGGPSSEPVAPEEIRARVAVVFQNFIPYGLTVRENIGLGAWRRMDDLVLQL